MAEEDCMKEIKELIDKHKLPDFEELDHEFEIITIEVPCNSFPKAIRQKIAEKIYFFAKMLEDILYHPDNTYATMYEAQAFNESERIKMHKLFRNLMFIERTNLELNLILDEEKDIELIKNTFDEWKQMKSELIKIVDKIKAVWKSGEKKSENVNYFG